VLAKGGASGSVSVGDSVNAGGAGTTSRATISGYPVGRGGGGGGGAGGPDGAGKEGGDVCPKQIKGSDHTQTTSDGGLGGGAGNGGHSGFKAADDGMFFPVSPVITPDGFQSGLAFRPGDGGYAVTPVSFFTTQQFLNAVCGNASGVYGAGSVGFGYSTGGCGGGTSLYGTFGPPPFLNTSYTDRAGWGAVAPYGANQQKITGFQALLGLGGNLGGGTGSGV